MTYLNPLCSVPSCPSGAHYAGLVCTFHRHDRTRERHDATPCVCLTHTPAQRAARRQARGDVFWMFDPPYCGESCDKLVGR